jgi:AraC family transcriptional regulator, exoenzyme S synthesis regulatory protein ExsA
VPVKGTFFYSMINSYDFKVAHPDIIRQLSVKDMLFAYYKCPQVEKQVNLFIHYNLITFTIRGMKTIHHREKSWTLTDNTCIFVRKGAYNQERYDTADWEVLAFYFGDDYLRNVFNEFRSHLPLKKLPPPPADMLIDINVNDTAIGFFYGMIPYFTQSIAPSETLLELKFKELLFNVLSNPANKELLSYVNSMEDGHKTPVWQTMEANYTYNLSIEEYARIAGRSIADFRRAFEEYYHTSPGRWLTQKRLEYARYLLDTSNKNISEVADASGFENLTHFSRIFKQRYRLSPLHYRKKEKHLSVSAK